MMADFRKFLEAKRPAGCETPIAIVRRALQGTDAEEPFEELIRGERGGTNNPFGRAGKPEEEINRDTITVDSEPPATIPLPAARDYTREAPTGTSVSYALRRLSRQAPIHGPRSGGARMMPAPRGCLKTRREGLCAPRGCVGGVQGAPPARRAGQSWTMYKKSNRPPVQSAPPARRARQHQFSVMRRNIPKCRAGRSCRTRGAVPDLASSDARSAVQGGAELPDARARRGRTGKARACSPKPLASTPTTR